ncbi:hypothetical protein HanHA89_Chr09g0338021 [Helianthus annuus]|nr:hypothetical protein HanHA89_Chr09g0338021 [Helianthus annuus]
MGSIFGSVLVNLKAQSRCFCHRPNHLLQSYWSTSRLHMKPSPNQFLQRWLDYLCSSKP